MEQWDARPRPPEVPPTEGEVQEFVQRAQGGEAAAFTRLYEAYFNRVYRFVALRVDNSADAEDLTEDVFLRMLESIGSFRWRAEVGFTPWLLRIAHNRVVDYWRRSRTRTGIPLEEAPPLPSEREDPQTGVALLSDAQELQAALGRLTELQRHVLALRFGAGLSLAETAQAMKRTEGAVKALQNSAVAALRRILIPGSA